MSAIQHVAWRHPEQRFEEMAEELGELQPLNNNDCARFAAIVVPHGLDLATRSRDEADAAVRDLLEQARWWCEDESRWAWPNDWSVILTQDPSPQLHRLDPDRMTALVDGLDSWMSESRLPINQDDPLEAAQLPRLQALLRTHRQWLLDSQDAVPMLAYHHRLPFDDDDEELFGYPVLAASSAGHLTHRLRSIKVSADSTSDTVGRVR